MQPSRDLLCVICDAAIVLLLMLLRGLGVEGQGVRAEMGLTKLKSYSVGHGAAMLLALNLFYWMKKIQI